MKSSAESMEMRWKIVAYLGKWESPRLQLDGVSEADFIP